MRKYKYKKIYLAKGIKIAAVSCGLGSRKRLDLMLTELKPGSKISALFTKSSVLAAPVQWSKSIISKGNVRYILAIQLVLMPAPENQDLMRLVRLPIVF